MTPQDSCRIVEVSPRDGLQNEATVLSTADKLALIGRAEAAGLTRIEVASFVNPARVPQMADAEAVVAALAPGGGHIALALNARGFDRAVASGVAEVNFAVMASETFNRRNQGADTFASLADLAELMQRRPRGMALSLTIGTAFGCPFEAEVPLARLLRVVEAAMAAPPDEIALADTIGVAAPRDVATRVAAVREVTGPVPLRLHFHNTRGTGLANAWAGLEAGVRVLDASLGGIGGCPFAPRATGNIATEDLVYMLERSGVATGVDLDAAIAAAEWLQARLGRTVPGLVMKAGRFPPG